VVIVALGWLLTDKIIEPRLPPWTPTPEEANPEETTPEETTPEERRGLRAGSIALAIGIAGIALVSYPKSSPLRTTAGALFDVNAPFMKAIVPIALLLLLLGSVVHGYASGAFTTHRDVVKGMNRAMDAMGDYLVMALCASLFFYAFNKSKLGALFAVVGGKLFEQMTPGGTLAVVGVIVLCAVVNLWIAPAPAKWALLAPIVVPLLMRRGMAPELAQAAYRVGDSTTDIVTPFFPYFPLVVACARRYLRDTGVGTVMAIMSPYAAAFFVGWSALLLVFWATGIPLGIHGVFHYP
jgi:aminobenzoyl-glutamate transport protein